MALSYGLSQCMCDKPCGFQLVPNKFDDVISTSEYASDDVRERLQSMARCMQDICHLDIVSNMTIKELAAVHRSMSNFSIQRDDSNCRYSRPLFLRGSLSNVRYTIPLLGYVCSTISMFTFISNILICIVLLKPHMRNPTNILLVALAISDLLTNILPLPIQLHFYVLENVLEWIPYRWCEAQWYLNVILPTITHTASIWFTVTLAVVRYLCVCSTKTPTWYTNRNAVYATIPIALLATLTHGWRLFDRRFVETTILSTTSRQHYVSACLVKGYNSLLKSHKFQVLYLWFRVIFVVTIPGACLIVATALMIQKMRVAQRRRKKLTEGSSNRTSQRLKETNRTTAMLVVVAIIFLLTEFPYTVVTILLLVDRLYIHELMVPASNALIQLNCLVNFFIYCGMSKKFRETFKDLFRRSSASPDRPLPSISMTLNI